LGKSKIKKLITGFIENHLHNKVSANQMTLVALLLGLLSALFIWMENLVEIPPSFILILQWTSGDTMVLVASILMICSFFADVLDGTLARLSKPTIFGGIFDIFSDRLVEVSIIIAIILTDPMRLALPGAFSLGTIVLCITIFLLVGGAVTQSGIENLNETKKVIYYSKGIMERTETFLFLLAIVMLHWIRQILLIVFAILIFITAFQRFYHAYKMFRL
jgi:phosphatidylglycerophosphate synthase